MTSRPRPKAATTIPSAAGPAPSLSAYTGSTGTTSPHVIWVPATNAHNARTPGSYRCLARRGRRRQRRGPSAPPSSATGADDLVDVGHVNDVGVLHRLVLVLEDSGRADHGERRVQC